MLIFSDLDGTLLTSKKSISNATWQALDALADAGACFVPCTGRALQGIDPQLLAHPCVHYAVTSNGAAIYELEHRTTLLTRPVGPISAADAWEACTGLDVTYDIFADGVCHIPRALYDRLGEFVPDPHMLAGMLRTRVPFDEPVDEHIKHLSCIERVSMYWKHQRDRDELRRRLATLPHIELTRSYPTNIEVMAAGVSKGSALVWLRDYLNVAPQDVVAFGDNINDITMLREAGIGVAVANAEEETQAAAQRITLQNDEDGVACALMELLKR